MTIPDLHRAVVDRRTEFLDLLRELVRIETPTGDLAGAERFVAHLRAVLEGDAWAVETDEREGVGALLVARMAGRTDSESTLLLAHYDTVHDVGTLERSPWRVEGDVAYGPGALDMKAGIAAAIVALRALHAVGGTPAGRVTLLVTSDEETGSHASRERIEREAGEHDRVLVLEPSRDDGALKLGRKGVADFHLTFEGRAAHAGLAPETGASALVELARAALTIADLGDAAAGTTVNPTVARSGQATNVIPDHARLSVDVRLPTMVEAERVEGAIRGYVPHDPEIRVRIDGGVNRPPMEATVGNRRLLARAQAIGATWGWSVESAVVGGGSDGNFTSALGVATLDGVGAVGGGAHTLGEHVRVGETLDRVALVANLLASDTGAVAGDDAHPPAAAVSDGARQP
ncbi:M20 family metallopeptidase [soil metagenome]